MADQKISELTEHTTLLADDLFVVVDSALSTTKKVKYTNVLPHISAATTFYVATTGSDTTGDGTSGTPWATVSHALTYLDSYRLHADVTISVAAGAYAETAMITVTHLDANRISITGPAYLSKTMSSVQSSSGSSGAWSMVVNLNNVTGITTDCFALFTNTANGTRARALAGVHQVTNVDSGNSRITVTCNNYSSTGAASGAVTADVTIITAKLTFNGTGGFAIKSSLSNGLTIKFLTNIMLHQTGTVGTTVGLDFIGFVGSGGYATYYVGISGFGTGIRTAYGNSIYAPLCYLSSNSTGAWVGHNSILIWNGYITGGTNGIWATLRAYVSCSTQNIFCCNSYGISCDFGAFVDISSGNVGYTTGTALYAAKYGYIDAVSTGNDTNGTWANPTVNTQGNEYGYIDT
jgi:hypothetical protein